MWTLRYLKETLTTNVCKMTPFLISTPQLQLIVNTLYNIFEETTSYSLLFLCQASRINKRVSSNMPELASNSFN